MAWARGPASSGNWRAAQALHIIDALHGCGAFSGRELLVPENCQAFFQGKLEPVAAGYAIACPVMEIFVRDDAFDEGIVCVCRGIRLGQNVLRVEDIEALIFHSPHIESGNGDDIELPKVIFQAVNALIPGK